jgi:hypothetical protein
MKAKRFSRTLNRHYEHHQSKRTGKAMPQTYQIRDKMRLYRMPGRKRTSEKVRNGKKARIMHSVRKTFQNTKKMFGNDV